MAAVIMMIIKTKKDLKCTAAAVPGDKYHGLDYQEVRPHWDHSGGTCDRHVSSRRSVWWALLALALLMSGSLAAAWLYISLTTTSTTPAAAASNDDDPSSALALAAAPAPVGTEVSDDSCAAVSEGLRFDCFPGNGVTSEKCLARGCCWRPSSAALRRPSGVPACFYPAGYDSHGLVNVTWGAQGVEANYVRKKPSGYSGDYDRLKLDIVCNSDRTVRISVADDSGKAFRMPQMSPLHRGSSGGGGGSRPDDAINLCAELDIQLDPVNFGFSLRRKASGQILFDSLNVGGMVFSEQLIQISTLLPSPYIYGLGEHYGSFLKSVYWSTFTFWNTDQAPVENTNLYGSHPFYMALDETGSAVGVYFKNSHAMEVVLQPTPALTFRALGGVLDIWVMVGPSPVEVIEQYTSIVGKPFLPPYWSLGYHQCKFGYNSLSRTQEILNKTRLAGIPIDVQWNDIDYMDQFKDFTYDKDKFAGLPDFVDRLHQDGMRYVQIVDPGISASEAPGSYPPYDLGLQAGIFIKNSTDQPFVGKVWNTGTTVWPDFTHPEALDYWGQMLQNYYKQVKIDGVWIDMNEPSNFWDGAQDGCTKVGHPDYKLDHPDYVPRGIAGGTLYHKTVCPSARQALGSHYQLHNLHGLYETMLTSTAMMHIRQKRPFVVSRSTFPGQGHYGAHWTGDVFSTWHDMKMSIPQIINFNMFGIPMVGADICGFNGNTTVELCKRWMQLGAFYPFSRNHNTDNGIDQDPVSLGPEVVSAAKRALDSRYLLLPFLYANMVRSHLHGTPAVRATMFNYPFDRNTYNLDAQFMWGSDLLVIPVLSPQSKVEGYFPRGTWYDFYNKAPAITSRGAFIKVGGGPDANDDIPLFFRAGSIIPLQRNGSNSDQSRKNPFLLRVYFPPACQGPCKNQEQQAKGELYFDDGESLNSYDRDLYIRVKFTASAGGGSLPGAGSPGHLRSTVTHAGAGLVPPKLEHVGLHGIPDLGKVKKVTINAAEVKFYVDLKLGMMGVPNLGHDLAKEFNLAWSYI